MICSVSDAWVCGSGREEGWHVLTAQGRTRGDKKMSSGMEQHLWIHWGYYLLAFRLYSFLNKIVGFIRIVFRIWNVMVNKTTAINRSVANGYTHQFIWIW